VHRKASGAGLICRTDQYFQRLPYTCGMYATDVRRQTASSLNTPWAGA